MSAKSAKITAELEEQASRKWRITSTSSMHRKMRRFILGLSIFHLVGEGAESIDVAELRVFLEAEREKLKKYLSLYLEGAVSFPLMSKNYLDSIQEEPSLERCVMACHLLKDAPSLKQLFETYETHGVALINQIGLLRAVEESVFNVTNRIGDEALKFNDDDKVIDELKMLASETNAYRRKNNGGDSRGRGSFFLGLQPGGDNKDLSDLGERRRSSIVAMSGAKEENVAEPPCVHMECDEHGVERFFLADLRCAKCEQEAHDRQLAGSSK